MKINICYLFLILLIIIGIIYYILANYTLYVISVIALITSLWLLCKKIIQIRLNSSLKKIWINLIDNTLSNQDYYQSKFIFLPIQLKIESCEQIAELIDILYDKVLTHFFLFFFIWNNNFKFQDDKRISSAVSSSLLLFVHLFQNWKTVQYSKN